MEVAACAVGRIGEGGPWVGFAPSLDDAYSLVIGDESVARRATAAPDDLISLAAAYFEEALAEPPEELAATHADIGALVRHVAEHETDAGRRRLLGEAVDAVDDGLEPEVTIARLHRALRGDETATDRLRRRVEEVLGSG